jgi:hypothetical protein
LACNISTFPTPASLAFSRLDAEVSSLIVLAIDISLSALLYFALLLRRITSTRGPQAWRDPREPGQIVSQLPGLLLGTSMFRMPGNEMKIE